MRSTTRSLFASSAGVLACVLTLVIAARSDVQVAARQAPAAPAAVPEDLAALQRYCVTCHNQFVRTADLALDTLDAQDVGAHAEVWEKVVRKVRTGVMPPSGAARPERDVLDAMASAIEARLDRVSNNARLASPALHRLNRTEYANAIRDLLALDVDVEALLPPDGSSEGFDNIAEALGVSPALIQGYVSAAMKISRQAVGDRTIAPAQVVYSAPPNLAQDRHIEGLPLGTRGGMLVHHTFPLDAEYEIAAGGGNVYVSLDGEPIAGAGPRGAGPRGAGPRGGGPRAGGGGGGGRGGGGRGGLRVKVAAGPHVIGAAVIDQQRGAGVDEIYSDFRTDATFAPAGGVQSVTITGPFEATGVGDTPSRRRIFVCAPANTAEEAPCARTILSTLARRAYRGPVTAEEIDTLMAFYQSGRDESDFETGIQRALARLLVAPRFAYRIEEAPADVPEGGVYRVGDIALASRLSFFLWSSIPDEELLDLAEAGRLREPAMLRQQVRRMLADPKADALITNFAGQWLYLRELEHVQSEAPAFDDNLRRAFRRETELLFSAIVRDDRSLIELLDADYTFVDERLARHYGIPDVRGSYFRRVPLPPDHPRRGLLGQGSLLTVTSVATRTSPVMRGQWILEHLLGTPAPDPPPGVETNLEEDVAAVATTSLRQRLERHRSNPVCASCHNVIDPLGFALENFDLIGAWRESDGGAPIDASGRLADGTAIEGPDDLRQALLARSGAFMTTATEKLLTYALGRGVHYYDMPAVRAILRRAADEDNRFSALVLGIVETDQFQMRVKSM